MSNIYYPNNILLVRIVFTFHKVIMGKYVLFVYNRKPQSNDALWKY